MAININITNDLQNRVLAEYFALKLIEECKFSFASKDDVKEGYTKFNNFRTAFESGSDDAYENISDEDMERFEKYFDIDDKELKEKIEVSINNKRYKETNEALNRLLADLIEMCNQIGHPDKSGKQIAAEMLSVILTENGITDGYVKKTIPGMKSVLDVTTALLEHQADMKQLNQISLLFSKNNKSFDFESLQNKLSQDFMAYNDTSVVNKNIQSCSDSIRKIAEDYVARVEITRKQDEDVDLMYESRTQAGADDGVKRKMNKLTGILLSAGSPNGSAKAEYEEYVRFWKNLYGDEKGQIEVYKTLGVSADSENKEKECFQKFVSKSEELYYNFLAGVLTQKYDQLTKNKDSSFDKSVYLQNFNKYIQHLKEGRNNLLVLGFANTTDDKDDLGKNISDYRARQKILDEMNAKKIISYHHNTLTISGVIDFFKKFEPEKWKSLSYSQKVNLVTSTVNHIGQGMTAIGKDAHQSQEPKNGIIDLNKTVKDDAILVADVDFAIIKNFASSKDVSAKYPDLQEKFNKYVKGYQAYLDSDQKSGPSKVICKVSLPRTISENVSRVVKRQIARLHKVTRMICKENGNTL